MFASYHLRVLKGLLAGLILPLLLPAMLLAQGQEGLSLEDALKIAGERHPGLLSAKASVDGLSAAVTQSRSAYYPQVSLSALTSRSQTRNLVDNSLFTSNSVSPVVAAGNLTFFDFGRTYTRVAASRKDLASAEAALALERARVGLEVQESFFNVLRAESALTLTEKSLKIRRSFLRSVSRAYERGARSKFDLARSETDNEAAQLDKISALARLKKARMALLSAMGTPDAPWVVLRGTLEASVRGGLDEETSLQAALRLRPELKSGRARVQAQEYRRKSALYEHLPTIGLTGNYTLNRQVFTGGSSRSRSWEVGAVATINLFSGFGTQAGYRAESARLEQAGQDVADAARAVILEVRTALVTLKETEDRIEAARRLLASAERSLDLAGSQFERGRGGIFDLTDAQNQSLRAGLSLNDSLADHRIAVARLERALAVRLEDL